MNKKQIKSRVKAVEGRIKEVTGKLIGNEAMEKKGAAEKNAAKKKVLYEDLKEDARNLA
ncbi:MAG: hypothetical protein MUO39_07055 [Steroidobacteraceae bacterium]|nr:hypothetical protein [Steroidobacteraceae bacterium]